MRLPPPLCTHRLLTRDTDIAPEGFKSSQRPSYHEEEFFEAEEEEASEQITGNKGQILLVCAWVSVKARVSLQ